LHISLLRYRLITRVLLRLIIIRSVDRSAFILGIILWVVTWRWWVASRVVVCGVCGWIPLRLLALLVAVVVIWVERWAGRRWAPVSLRLVIVFAVSSG
jgi:hypothetical protein